MKKNLLIIIMCFIVCSVVGGCGFVDNIKLSIGDKNELVEEDNDDFITEETKLSEEISKDSEEVKIVTDNEQEDTKKKEAKLTSVELEEVLSQQPCYVEYVDYIRNLFGDGAGNVSVVVRNNSGTDIKNVYYAMAGWDANNFPLILYTYKKVDGTGYVVETDFGDANIVNGGTYGEGTNFGIMERTASRLETIKAVVVKYEDFDGNTWENPYYADWIELYKEKEIEETGQNKTENDKIAEAIDVNAKEMNAETKNLGDIIELPFVNMTIEKLEVADKYDFEYTEKISTGTATYTCSLEAESGDMKLVSLRGKITNKTNDTIYPSNKPVYGIFTINDNKYETRLRCYYIEKADMIIDIAAQQTVDYFLCAEVPPAVADNIENCTLQFGFLDGFVGGYINNIEDLDYIYQLEGIPVIKEE